jgi:hypothetical protein
LTIYIEREREREGEREGGRGRGREAVSSIFQPSPYMYDDGVIIINFILRRRE